MKYCLKFKCVFFKRKCLISTKPICFTLVFCIIVKNLENINLILIDGYWKKPHQRERRLWWWSSNQRGQRGWTETRWAQKRKRAVSFKLSNMKYACYLIFFFIIPNIPILFWIIIIFRLRRESAQIDRELEESQQETARLREVLRTREQEVQRLRERVAAQRATREQRVQRLRERVADERALIEALAQQAKSNQNH